MQFYRSFRNVNGFRNGWDVPPQARQVREVYVRFLNVAAAQLGSQVRAVAFDRGGLHNPLLILFTPVEDFKLIDPTRIATGVDNFAWEEVNPDMAMLKAVGLCDKNNIDEWVNVTVSIEPAFDAYLASFEIEGVNSEDILHP